MEGSKSPDTPNMPASVLYTESTILETTLKEILENLAFGQIGYLLKISTWGHGPNFWPINPILFF